MLRFVRLKPTVGKQQCVKLAGMLVSLRLASTSKPTTGTTLTIKPDRQPDKLQKDYALRVFDAAVGGLGGCPYAPGAKGNVATEAVNDLLLSLGFETGLDMAQLKAAANFAKGLRNDT